MTLSIKFAAYRRNATMTESFATALDRIKNNIGGLRNLDESSIKQGIVLNLLVLTGWNPFDVTEVVPEHTVGNRRVDFALNPNAVNAVFIEVKRPGSNLATHSRQLLEYCFQEGVNLGALTDGLVWWLYLPLQGGNWEQRRFLEINLQTDETETVVAYFTRFLSKQNVMTGQSVRDAEGFAKAQRRAETAQVAVDRAWSEIVGEPDEVLVKLIAETAERFCGFKPDDGLIEEFLKLRANATPHRVDKNPQPASVIKPSAGNKGTVGRDSTLPISLDPHDSNEFREALLRTKEAWIEVQYNDGRKITRLWDASRMRPSSNVIGNLRSRPEFRAGNWQRAGITSVRVTIQRPMPDNVGPAG